MAQKPNLHGLQNYSLRSGKYAIDPNAKSRQDGETKHERRLAPIERIKEAMKTNDVYFGLGLTTDDLNALANAIELFVFQFPIVKNTAIYFGEDLIRFENSGETAKVVNFKEYLYKADTTKQTTAYVASDMYNQTKKFIVGSPSKNAPFTKPIIEVLFNIVSSIGNGNGYPRTATATASQATATATQYYFNNGKTDNVEIINSTRRKYISNVK